jgi:hypothetical protein
MHAEQIGWSNASNASSGMLSPELSSMIMVIDSMNHH